MKKIIFIMFVLFVVGWWWMGKDPVELPNNPPKQLQPSVSPTSVLGLSVNEELLKTITTNGVSYRATWYLADNMELVNVGINEALASSSSSINNQQNCTALTSGAFYDTNDLPIGLVVSGGNKLSSWQKNQLFNGILSWDGSSLTIKSDEMAEYIWAIQAGPVLYRDGQPVVLQLKNDQQARRIIAGVTDGGKLLLAVVVANDSIFGGPFLADVPQIVSQLEMSAQVKLVSAINLDGGTASAFVSEGVTLRELKPIGSWICVK